MLNILNRVLASYCMWFLYMLTFGVFTYKTTLDDGKEVVYESWVDKLLKLKK